MKEYKKKLNKTKVICKPKEEIDKKINNDGYYFNIVFEKLNYNPKNNTNQLNPYLYLESFVIDNTIKKSSKYFFSNYVTESDDGLIFENTKIDDNKLGIKQMDHDFNSVEANSLMYINFFMSRNVNIGIRSFIKFQNIFAEIGGFIKFVLLIFNILPKPFFSKKIKLKIINEFFELQDNNNSNTKFLNIELNELFKIEKRINLKLNEKKRNENSIINRRSEIIDLSNNRLNNEDSIPYRKDLDKEENIEKNCNESKIIEILKKRQIFTNSEIFKSSYYFFCNNKEWRKKDSNYRIAVKNVSKATDFLEVIKMNREFKILKYLLLNNVQQKMLFFTRNLETNQDNLNDQKEYTEILHSKDIFETIKYIQKYYENKLKEDGISKIDEKIFKIIHPNIKKNFQ